MNSLWTEMTTPSANVLDDVPMIVEESPQEQPVPSIGLQSELQQPSSKCFPVFLSILVIIITLTSFAVLGVYALLWHKPFPRIDESLDAFSIPKHKVSLNLDALILAEKNAVQKSRGKRSVFQQEPTSQHVNYFFKSTKFVTSKGKHLNYNNLFRHKRSSDFQKVSYQRIPRWKLQVVFIAQGGSQQNIFTSERLQHIHQIELNIMSHPGFQDFCLKEKKSHIDEGAKHYGGCQPLNSLLSYFYPSMNQDGKIFYDGLGSNIDKIDSALRLAMNTATFYYFVDGKINRTYLKSHFLRSEVLFGAPLEGFHSWKDRTSEQTEKFKNFVVTYIRMLSASSNDKVLVLYGCNELFDYEVDNTFWEDMQLVWISVVCIVLFMLVLTCSLWLTIIGLLSILISFPLAFFFYRVIFGKNAVGILTGASVFLIIGIGVDDVFVFVNVFRQSSVLLDFRSRMVYTVTTAGKATFFTSLTTAAAFAANISSYIPAIHDFGLFMFLMVSCCWFAVVLLLPPALYLWHISCSLCEAYLCKYTETCSFLKLQLPADMSQLCYQKSGHYSNRISTVDTNLEEDVNYDVPLLSMDGLNINDMPEMAVPALSKPDDSAEDDLLIPASMVSALERPTYDMAEYDDVVDVLPSQAISFSSFLQAVLYYYVARPVVYARYVIIGVFVVLLCVSVSMVTQMHPASKPPQLFRPTTNLQKLLNFKANLSLEPRISCDDCSGLYKEHAVKFPLPESKNHANGNPQKYSHQNFHKRKVSLKAVTETSPLNIWNYTTAPTKKLEIREMHESVHRTRRGSVEKNFDVCQSSNCKDPKDRPLLGSGAVVYVTFGIKGIDQTNVTNEHVINVDKGTVIYDKDFQNAFSDFTNINTTVLVALCKMCQLIATNAELVHNGTAQCLPDYMPSAFKVYLSLYPECQDLPGTIRVFGHQAPAPAIAGFNEDKKGLKWIAFAFESTTVKSDSYFIAYRQYLKWEAFLEKLKQEVLSDVDPLQSVMQISSFWKRVLREVVVVSSAIYSLLLSMAICIVATAIFTGHITLLFIICFTILSIICLVMAIFYLLGWEIGSIEAVSLSILVGSSIDYCVHLVEGYLISGQYLKISQSPSGARQWRTKAAITHIGVSIVSSAITTVMAAIPLTQTTILPFSKFGCIIAINTSIAILFTLTLCPALLSTIAPARFCSSWRSTGMATFVILLLVGVVISIMYGVSYAGVVIPGPNGDSIF